MPKLTVNGQEVEVPQGATVLQACEEAGAEIPRFCYHERLSIAGNCRMCLVQIEGGPPKPAASCAMPAGEGMVVHTDSPMVKKAREGVMEFLLANHPLDCPICDQGGECDLQDQAMAYGCGTSRYAESKRSVEDKYMGPLIKTQMTRCIHCTRCVRFSQDVAGVEELGAVHRGEHMEITTYVEKAISSEMSGNMIDLCPVGALTSKPYAFTARPWELRKAESIDVLDAVGSNIRVDYRGREVMRILPRLNEAVNEEWISDKARFSYDGLKVQRLDRPYVRRNGKLEAVNWEAALQAVADKLTSIPAKEAAAIAGDLVDVESMFALKQLLDSLGVEHMDCRQDGAKIDVASRSGYLFNTTFEGLEEADACLIVGANLRVEAPVVNSRLFTRYLKGGLSVAVVGDQADLAYKADFLGNNPDVLKQIADGKHPFAKVLKKAKRPVVILGQGAIQRNDGVAVLDLVRTIAEEFGAVTNDWNGFNMLHTAAARVGGLDIGFVPQGKAYDVDKILKHAKSGKIKFVYLLGADEVDVSALSDAFVVYQGHHGDAGAQVADVILPGAAYTEKTATYVNMEGLVQRARMAVYPPGEAREDWKIIRMLSDNVGKPLLFDTVQGLRRQLEDLVPHMAEIDTIIPAVWGEFGEAGKLLSKPFKYAIDNFYLTNPISRASATMAECVRVLMDVDQQEAA